MNRMAPPTPKKSIGFRPKRSWNQTETRSNTPTGIRLQLNLEMPARRGYSGTGSDVEPVAVRRGDHDHVAMPVGPQRHAGHHLAAVRLDRVEIGDPDPEEPAAESVVDPGDERLLVLALLGAGDDVGAAVEDRRDQAGNVLGEVLQIGGIEDEHIAPRHVAGRAERVGDAALAAVGHDPEKGILPLQIAQHPVAVVARAVVDDDDFEGEAGRRQGLGAAPDELGKVVRLVLGRDEDADVQRLDRATVIPACACAPEGCRAGRGTWRPCGGRSGSPAPGRGGRSAGR